MRKSKGSKPPKKYVVGYRRPPKATQFKPGESGNPKGRPKGSRPVGAVLQEIMQQRVPVTEGNKTRRLPVLEVIMRRLANDAMRNDPRAIKLLLSFLDRYAQSPEADLQLDELLADDQTILTQYLRDAHNSRPDSSAASGKGPGNAV